MESVITDGTTIVNSSLETPLADHTQRLKGIVTALLLSARYKN